MAAADNGGLTVAAFRGTESNKPEDLLADLVLAPIGWNGGGRVHRGFMDAYAAERDEIAAGITGHATGRLVVTGHSLGAAIATLAAVEHRAKAPTLITFGSPRVGDREFVALLGAIDCRRFVDCCDLVARIPPPSMHREPLSTLLRELSGTRTLSTAMRLALEPLSHALRRLTGGTQFEHVSPPLYANQAGQPRPQFTAAEMEDDQWAARDAYPHRRATGFDSLLSQVAWPLGPDIERARGALLALARGLFANADVPIRDLADHAPINYVSIFSGRR